MEKRWIIFLIITFAVVNFFTARMQKEQQLAKKKSDELKKTEISKDSLEQQTTATQHVSVDQSLAASDKDITPTEQISVEPAIPQKEAEKIDVETDLYSITFTTEAAQPIKWQLINKSLINKDGKTENSKPINIIPQFEQIPEGWSYPFELEIPGFQATNRLVYDSNVAENSNGTTITFTSPVYNSIQIEKKYFIPKDSYLVDFSLRIINKGTNREPIDDGEGNGFALSWGAGIGESSGFSGNDKYYIAPVFLKDESVEGKTTKAKDAPKTYSGQTDWAGIENTYFLAAFIPQNKENISAVKTQTKTIIFANKQDEANTTPPIKTSLLHEKFILEPNSTVVYDYKVFVGPKDYKILTKEGYGLKKIMFRTSWNWVRALCIILMKTLNMIYDFVHNYGIAILLITVLVKIITYPLTSKGMKMQAAAMKEQMRIKPILDAINEKYKNDPQEKNRQVMKAYKEHGINPFAPLRGCVPLLIQLPIFIALYKLLGQMVDLRGASFLWIKDLSGEDALFLLPFTIPMLGWTYFNILPLAMGVSQYFVSKLSPVAPSSDPMQKQMMTMMPIIFTIMLYKMPSGLVLYWLVSNLWQLGQQIITNKLSKA